MVRLESFEYEQLLRKELQETDTSKNVAFYSQDESTDEASLNGANRISLCLHLCGLLAFGAAIVATAAAAGAAAATTTTTTI